MSLSALLASNPRIKSFAPVAVVGVLALVLAAIQRRRKVKKIECKTGFTPPSDNERSNEIETIFTENGRFQPSTSMMRKSITSTFLLKDLRRKWSS
jgi:hypothetical protein